MEGFARQVAGPRHGQGVRQRGGTTCQDGCGRKQPAAATAAESLHQAASKQPAQLTSCTAAMPGMRSRSFWVTATRTVMTLAAGPVMRT